MLAWGISDMSSFPPPLQIIQDIYTSPVSMHMLKIVSKEQKDQQWFL